MNIFNCQLVQHKIDDYLQRMHFATHRTRMRPVLKHIKPCFIEVRTDNSKTVNTLLGVTYYSWRGMTIVRNHADGNCTASVAKLAHS